MQTLVRSHPLPSLRSKLLHIYNRPFCEQNFLQLPALGVFPHPQQHPNHFLAAAASPELIICQIFIENIL